jgi:hypothetical protein
MLPVIPASAVHRHQRGFAAEASSAAEFTQFRTRDVETAQPWATRVFKPPAHEDTNDRSIRTSPDQSGPMTRESKHPFMTVAFMAVDSDVLVKCPHDAPPMISPEVAMFYRRTLDGTGLHDR